MMQPPAHAVGSWGEGSEAGESAGTGKATPTTATVVAAATASLRAIDPVSDFRGPEAPVRRLRRWHAEGHPDG